jgi:hypothetical protein
LPRIRDGEYFDNCEEAEKAVKNWMCRFDKSRKICGNRFKNPNLDKDLCKEFGKDIDAKVAAEGGEPADPSAL